MVDKESGIKSKDLFNFTMVKHFLALILHAASSSGQEPMASQIAVSALASTHRLGSVLYLNQGQQSIVAGENRKLMMRREGNHPSMWIQCSRVSHFLCTNDNDSIITIKSKNLLRTENANVFACVPAFLFHIPAATTVHLTSKEEHVQSSTSLRANRW